MKAGDHRLHGAFHIAVHRLATSWLFVVVGLWYLHQMCYGSWVAVFCLGIIFSMLLLLRNYRRFLARFWNYTLAGLLAPIWDSAWMYPILGRGPGTNQMTQEPQWANAARIYWQNQYAVHRFRPLWFMTWITVMLLGPCLIFLILSGHGRWAEMLAIPYLLALLPHLIVMHRTVDKTRALSNATGAPSTAFAAIAASIPLPSDAWIPIYLHPRKPAPFARWLMYFAVAMTPVMAPFLHYPPLQVVAAAMFTLKVAAFLLLSFSWLIVVVRMGLPLARYGTPLHTAEEICVWVFRDDLLAASAI
ncbi:hypothetical protein JKG47_01135 [Acidithiobacillus sp. MC6.1]|nr:hypothetical protein [Acidithiobacillus sp. MC6.1]